MSEINMVPFIDIMMVMLVAFMVSSPMFTQGFRLSCQKPTAKPSTCPRMNNRWLSRSRPMALTT